VARYHRAQTTHVTFGGNHAALMLLFHNRLRDEIIRRLRASDMTLACPGHGAAPFGPSSAALIAGIQRPTLRQAHRQPHSLEATRATIKPKAVAEAAAAGDGGGGEARLQPVAERHERIDLGDDAVLLGEGWKWNCNLYQSS
jgi:hypothetical protein